MMKLVAALLFSGLLIAAPSATAQQSSQEAPTLRSYTTSWEVGLARYRSIMFPHETTDGCKIMIQSKRYIHNERGTFTEMEGPDCNCDLIIDGEEKVFKAAEGYTADKLLDVCLGEGMPGNTRREEIQRESLKENPNFNRMKNVAEPIIGIDKSVRYETRPDIRYGN